MLRVRRKCISCKPLHNRSPYASFDLFFLYSQEDPSAISTAVVAPGRKEPMARRRILCSRMWIPSVLFPREAKVLLDLVTSRHTSRRGGGYFCIMLHVRGVSCLTSWTHLHSVQKHSAAQPLPLDGEDRRQASSFSFAVCLRLYTADSVHAEALR